MNATHAPFEEMAAAYALDALDAPDRRVFEQHLTTCAACQHEVADLRRVATGLGLAVDPIDPPPALKARVLAAATAQAQIRSFRHDRRSPSLAPWLALAAAVILTTLTGVYAWRIQQRADRERAGANARISDLEQRLAIMSAPDMVQVKLQAQPDAPGSSAQVFMSAKRGMVLTAEHLPALAAGRTYQLWVVTKQAPVGIGTFTVQADGSVTGVMPISPQATIDPVAVAVTIEPEGGVSAPTGPKVLVGMLTPL